MCLHQNEIYAQHALEPALVGFDFTQHGTRRGPTQRGFTQRCFTQQGFNVNQAIDNNDRIARGMNENRKDVN